jgi:hypothetical protein
MVDTRILLAFIWVAVMLVFLLGDVLRIFSGDMDKGDMVKQLREFGQGVWLGIAVLMLTPILMILLTLVLDQPASRILNIVAAVAWFLFNGAGLPTYPSHYDRFLLVVSMVFNVITVYYAWNWM